MAWSRRFFLEKSNYELDKQIKGFSPEVEQIFKFYKWPGNLRELRNAIERAVIMVKGNKINPEDLPAELRGETASRANGSDPSPQVGSLISMEHLEEAHLRKVLERTSNLAEAAQVLGIDQATLYRKRKKIGLE